jgi:murein DD-endopeptidase MepM/ murein hydrolase activator NlpD
MYFKGDSGRVYWLGHIDNRLPVGTKVKAGQAMAVISSDHKHPHLHFDYKE